MADVIIPGGPEDRKRKKQVNKPRVSRGLTLGEAFQRGRQYSLEGQERGLDTDSREFFGKTLSTEHGPLNLGAKLLEETEALGMGGLRMAAEVAKKAGLVDDADRLAGEISDIAMVTGVAGGMTPARPMPSRPRNPKRGETLGDVVNKTRKDTERQIVDMTSEGDPVADRLPAVPPRQVTADAPAVIRADNENNEIITPEQVENIINRPKDERGLNVIGKIPEPPSGNATKADWTTYYRGLTNWYDNRAKTEWKNGNQIRGDRFKRMADDARAAVSSDENLVLFPEKGKDTPDLPVLDREKEARLNELLYRTDLSEAEYDELDALLGATEEVPPARSGRGGGDGMDGDAVPLRPLNGSETGKDTPETPEESEEISSRLPTGSIGPGQDAIPDELQGAPIPKQPKRSREDTATEAKKLGINRRNIGEKGRVGDVAAIVERTKKLTTDAGNEFLRRWEFFGPDSKESADAMDSWVRNTLIHSENSSNLGRGLQTLNDGLSAKESQRLIDRANDPAFRTKIADLVSKYRDDPKALEKIARDVVDPTMRDRIFSFRYNMMLSGPKTHVYNILGTSSNILVDLAEHGLAAIGGQARKLRGNEDRVSGSEVASRIIGAVVGARRGLSTMKQAYREGRPLDDTIRADMMRGRVDAWEVPVKLLSAEDEFFRSVANMSDVYGMAVRIARKEGHKGKALFDRITELIDNPNKEMEKSAGEYAKRMRFQDDPSWLGQQLERARNMPVRYRDKPLSAAARDFTALTLPFVRTPDSLIRTAIRRSPAGVFDAKNIEDWKAGGARRDTAVARVALGSGIAATIAMKVFEGEITGDGPGNYKERQALELTGWQPNSVKIGDKYYSYFGAEPFSILLNTIATTMERWRELSGEDYVDKTAKIIGSVVASLKDQMWLEGVSDLFEALDEAKTSGIGAGFNNWVSNIAQSFAVPAVTRQINQTYIDPIARDTRGDDGLVDRVTGRIQSGLPGLSDELPAQRDALGRDLGKGETLGPDILSRMTAPRVENNAVAAELDRLTKGSGKVVLDRVSRTVNTKDFPLGRLNALEHSEYQMVTGDYFTAMMEETLDDPAYQAMSDPEKIKHIRKLAKNARAWAREEVFNPNGIQ